jgi:hypothetical protein
MRKLVLLTLIVFLMTGLASSAFIEIDGNQSQQSDVTVNAQSQNSQSFVSITGDTLRGALDMAGFGITGLPSPDRGSDVATKSYVDRALGTTGSNSSSIPGLSQVLSVNNVATGSIGFLNGIELGTGSSAESDSIAVGRDAEASAENSVAIGKDARADKSGEAVIGSNQNPMDLKVTGNLEVEGNQGVWTTSINTSENSTFVNLTEEDFGSDYTVSATPVGSMENIGVFNKTSDGFDVKSTGETRADITIFH